MWMVKGDLDTLQRIRESSESKRLTAMGGYLLDEFCVDFYMTADGADEYLGRYAAVVEELS